MSDKITDPADRAAEGALPYASGKGEPGLAQNTTSMDQCSSTRTVGAVAPFRMFDFWSAISLHGNMIAYMGKHILKDAAP